MEAMMNVYYDSAGEIKAITPVLDKELGLAYSVSQMPLSTVSIFLTSQANPFNFLVKNVSSKDGPKSTLVKKLTNVKNTRTLDNYLTKLGSVRNSNNIISIENRILSKVIVVIISKEFLWMYNNSSAEEISSINEFRQQGQTSIHITKKNDPYSLFLTVSFVPEELFVKQTLYFNYSMDCKNTSAYSRRIIEECSYIERVK